MGTFGMRHSFSFTSVSSSRNLLARTGEASPRTIIRSAYLFDLVQNVDENQMDKWWQNNGFQAEELLQRLADLACLVCDWERVRYGGSKRIEALSSVRNHPTWMGPVSVCLWSSLIVKLICIVIIQYILKLIDLNGF